MMEMHTPSFPQAEGKAQTTVLASIVYLLSAIATAVVVLRNFGVLAAGRLLVVWARHDITAALVTGTALAPAVDERYFRPSL